ncbi:MAG: cytochrome c3 family protein [Myxococcales bacterium]|nr:cytochrome c3 family protein [Myxococcales bacterium]
MWSPRAQYATLLLVLTFAALVPLFSACGAETRPPDPVSREGVWSPPGAVAWFLIGDEPPQPPRDHDGETWAAFRASPGHEAHLGRVVCKECHAAAGFEDAGELTCASADCHADKSDRGHGATDGAGCTTCHGFRPESTTPACLDCHKDPQPRAVVVAELAPMRSAILDGHATVDCASCHSAHGDTEAPACTSCHTDNAKAHAAHEGSQGCSDCHADHAPASAARQSCKSCHEQVRAHGHAAAAQRGECVSCHQPHANSPRAAGSCSTCHSQKVTARTSKVTEHANCTSCHSAQAPTATADASCARCHTTVRVEHTARTGASHGASGPSAPRSCTGCHEPHAPDQKSAACTSCHATTGGAHAATLSCTSCHSPHQVALPNRGSAGAFCGRCHTSEVKLVSTQSGHANCASCHASVHAPQTPPRCASCHADEAASAPSGHAECSKCHEPHSGAVRSKDNCASCHLGQARTPHAERAGGCATCHKAHSVGAPATRTCQSCHATPQPKLHGIAEHATCANCHSAHGSLPQRQTCTSNCHVDRRDHEAAGPRCYACHLFR